VPSLRIVPLRSERVQPPESARKLRAGDKLAICPIAQLLDESLILGLSSACGCCGRCGIISRIRPISGVKNMYIIIVVGKSRQIREIRAHFRWGRG